MRTGWDGSNAASTASRPSTLDVPRPGTVLLFERPNRKTTPASRTPATEVLAPSSNPVVREQQEAAENWVRMVKGAIERIETPGLSEQRRQSILQATLDILGKQIASGLVGNTEAEIADWIEALSGKPALLAQIYNRADRIDQAGNVVRRI